VIGAIDDHADAKTVATYREVPSIDRLHDSVCIEAQSNLAVQLNMFLRLRC